MTTRGLLQEGNIRLRAPEPEDLEVMYRLENTADVWEMGSATGPYSRFHIKQYIEQTQNDLFTDRQLRLMIVQEDVRQVAGIIDLCSFDPLHNRAEVGILIDKPFRRQGIGRTALALTETHCFRALGIHQLFAYVAVGNLPCRKLFESSGYKENAILKDWILAKDGKYTDVCVVQKMNGD